MNTNGFFSVLTAFRSYIFPISGISYYLLGTVFTLPYTVSILCWALVAAMMTGIVLDLIEQKQAYDGTLVLDTSNADRDIYRLEVDCLVDDIKYKSFLRFRVREEDGTQE